MKKGVREESKRPYTRDQCFAKLWGRHHGKMAAHVWAAREAL